MSDLKQLKRLRYRSWHRGCKETDLILGQFSECRLAGLSPVLLSAYEQLLEEDDVNIWNWITGKASPPSAEYGILLEMMKPTAADDTRGFTLIELTVVLLIIGLIVGGVLIGRDMIEAAKLQKSVSQFEKIQNASNMFQLKYSSLPGDMSADLASQYGMETRAGTAGHGDGDGFIDGCAADAAVFGCETALYWRDLSKAGLITETFTAATDNLIAIPAGSVLDYLPRTELSATLNFVIHNGNAGSNSTLNGFALEGNYLSLIGVTSTDASGVYEVTTELTPPQAKLIDDKIDDGLPLYGRIVGGQRVFIPSTQGFIISDECYAPIVIGQPVQHYVLSANFKVCTVAIKL